MYTTPDGREFMFFESVDTLLEALRENFRGASPEARVRDGYVFRGCGWQLAFAANNPARTSDRTARQS